MKGKTVIGVLPGAGIEEQRVDRGMGLKEFAAKMDMLKVYSGDLLAARFCLLLILPCVLKWCLGCQMCFGSNLKICIGKKSKRQSASEKNERREGNSVFDLIE